MNYYFKSVLIVSDNKFLLEKVYEILLDKQFHTYISFVFACSPHAKIYSTIVPNLKQVDIKSNINDITERYSLIISLHCKQVFPVEVVRIIKCINIHPGFNPYNRGWYPHVFSIINKLPAGVTIHEMDEKIDHGPIIVQEELPLFPYDTSASVYKRLLDLEITLFSEYIDKIFKNDYKTYQPVQEGTINYQKDYEKLKQIDPQRTFKGQEIIDILRALSHDGYHNAYFVDDNKQKIFIKIVLEEEKK